MHHRHNRGYFGLLSEVWEAPPWCQECELREGICKTKHFTWRWKQWVPAPPVVVMMQWKPIQLFLKQNRLDSESLTLALSECVILHDNLKPTRAAQKYLWTTFTMHQPPRVLWLYVGLIKAFSVPYWPYFSTEMTAIRTWSYWVTLFESSSCLCFP